MPFLAHIASITRQRRAAAAYFVTLGALSWLLVASITSVDYLPTNDGPERIFSGQMLNHLHDPGRGYDKYLSESATLTNVGFEMVFARFEPWLGWRRAYQVVICLIALLWAWGGCALAASLGKEKRWLGLLGFASALQWAFYMGLFSWQMGTALGFFVLACAFRRGSSRTIGCFAMSALLLCQVVAHSFAALLTGLVLLVHALLSEKTRRLRAAAVLGLQALPAMAVGTWTLLHHLGNREAATYNYPSTSLVQRLELLARGVVSGPGWRAWPLVALAVCGLASFRRWRDLDVRDRTLVLSGLILTVAAVLLPLHTPGWEFFCVRFSPLGLSLLAMLALPRLSPKLLSVATAVAVIAYSGVSLAWSWHHHLRIREASADLLAGLEAPLNRQGLRLPLPLEPPPGDDPDEWARAIPFVATNSHLGALYAVAQGGTPSVLFAGLSAQSLRWRQPRETWMPLHPPRGYEWQLWEPRVRADPHLREAMIVRYLSFAAGFEDVILEARPEDAQLLERLGFAVDFHRGGMTVARFHGCPLAVTIPAPPEATSWTFLSAGWAGSTRPTYQAEIPPDAGSRSVAIPGSPCGDVWLRVLFDTDGDRKLSPGDRFCQGADEHAVVVHHVQAGAAPFVCAPGPKRDSSDLASAWADDTDAVSRI